jgi:phage gp46-like protein
MADSNRYIDIDLQKNGNQYYDIYFDSDGDLAKIKGFNTALKMSLMCERRASGSEVPLPQNRRGWWGNDFLGFDNFELGSKLWLLNQARSTQNNLNNSITYSQQAFQWLVDDNYADKVVVNAFYTSNSNLEQTIDLIRSNNVTASFGYSVWDNTFLEIDVSS